LREAPARNKLNARKSYASDGEEHAMSRLCEGRVAIVTGAGRGVGREHALLLAAHGAKVVVNDIGAKVDGSGKDATPANEVVAAIKNSGGQAIANGEDVSDWKGAKAMIDAAVAHFGRLDVVVTTPASCATACSPTWTSPSGTT
jgi:NAD(P)-dependent dehydrogenase (short-subunit alcohol dehydrogenase family)